jgi:hypothetical protein
LLLPPTLLDTIVGLVTVNVVPEFSTQIALSFAFDTEIDGLESVLVPLVNASAAAAYASLVLSCSPHSEELDDDATVMLTALDVLVA